MTTHRSRSHDFGRVVAGIAGLAALLIAGYSTVKTDNEIGTAAAYLTGLFFAAIAYTGQVPRVKIGDNELDPRALVEVGAQFAAGAAQQAAEHGDDSTEVAAAAQDAVKVIASAPVTTSFYPRWSRAGKFFDVPTGDAGKGDSGGE
jgi:hypothetical protein